MLVRSALDLGFLAALLAVLFRLADSDMLFHVVFVLLSVEAFAFNLRTAAPRIAIAFAAVIIDVLAPAGLSWEDFYTEWPLMFLIAAIVAIMAARKAEVTRQYAALYRDASERLLTAQEDERRRLALDLHDGVGQTLTALALSIDGALGSLPSRRDVFAARGGGRESLAQALDETRDSLELARQVVGGAIDETRGVAEQLRPARLRETGLYAAARELAGRAGIPTQVVADDDVGSLESLGAEQATTVFRIVQEALANAAKHSGAPLVRIRFSRAGGDLLIRVEDDGRGFDVDGEQPRGLGLAGMRERANVLGGLLRIDSEPGTGTRISLVLPGALLGSPSHVVGGRRTTSEAA